MGQQESRAGCWGPAPTAIAEAERVGDSVAQIVQLGGHHRPVPAAHDSKDDACQHEDDRGGNAGAVRKAPVLERSKPAPQVALQARAVARAPNDRRHAGRRARMRTIGHRFSEASSTIHRTSSSNVRPA
jgi:hypothetical protein